MTEEAKIYIAGKVAGEPIHKCVGKFRKATYRIRWADEIENVNRGKVINPLDLPGIHFGISRADAMKICMESLKECTHIYMLKDWKESKGATIEHEWAKENGLEIIYE